MCSEVVFVVDVFIPFFFGDGFPQPQIQLALTTNLVVYPTGMDIALRPHVVAKDGYIFVFIIFAHWIHQLG